MQLFTGMMVRMCNSEVESQHQPTKDGDRGTGFPTSLGSEQDLISFHCHAGIDEIDKVSQPISVRVN